MNAPPLRPENGLDRTSDRVAEPDGAPSRRWLSALADGDSEAAGPGCAAWRDDAEARRYWHTVHLIGDVLRSEELARAPGRDAAFLAGLRERLAAEPVPLAPTATAAAMATPSLRQRLGWRAPAAVAAGFAAVAVVVVVTRAGGEAGGPILAGAPGGVVTGGVVPVAAGAGGAPGASLQIRDPRLDAQLEAYLRAHQAARGGAAAALPGGALRNAEMVVVPVGPVGAVGGPPAPAAAGSMAGVPR
jgi:sigma-E factor negative regulatory protein RseA